MKAITLTQPWATLVAIGVKRIETRSWRTFYRGPLAIHASKRISDSEFRDFNGETISLVLEAHDIHSFHDLPLGVIVATCTLVRILRIYPDNVPAVPEFCFGDYTAGRWAWYLSDVKALAEPVPAKGNLGLWEWNTA